MSDLDLDALHLEAGAHDPDGRMCVMEAAAYIAGEEWGADPVCVSPVIADFLRKWNDQLDDDDRQQLKRWVVPVVGTAADPATEERRVWMCVDWMARVHTPIWLRAAGLTTQADRLEALPELNVETTPPILPVLEEVRSDADVAGGNAWNAFADAAGGDAVPAIGGPAWVAAWEAAGGSACVKAATEAGPGPWDAAWDAAWAAAWDAAGAATGIAIRDAVELRTTVEQLQRAAHDLVGRMIALSAEAGP